MACMTKVELSISCRNLLNRDLTSKSDPLCLLETFEESSQSWYELARTEQVMNSLDPDFSKKISIDYYFEAVQKLRFRIYDIDNASPTLGDDDFLGELECTLANIVSKKTLQQALLGKNKKHAGKGSIKIIADEVTDNRILMMSAKATKLDNKDFMGKSDPYLEFWKENDDGTWTVAHRTEVVKNSLNPAWKPMVIPLHTLCGADVHKKIKVVCNDWDSDGSHDLIGEFYTTVDEIVKAQKPKEFPCINTKKQKKKSYKNSGVVSILSSKIEKQYSFVEYVMGGLQINFTVGIDFTGSNGDPASPDSLHFMNPNVQNEYVQALIAVGNVVQDYDTDKLFPAFGFGAKLPPYATVSHEFALNFDDQNPYCAGVGGILQAYHQAVNKVKLWGPTNISPIINHVASFAYQAQNSQTTPQNYFILLLITDGVITDMDETRTAIVNASHLPMSIIIVGVGKADFSAMEMLDGDDGVLKSPTGQPVARDIVQFVPFHSLKKAGPAGLAKAVLAEVPTQVTTYFKKKNMNPGTGLPQAQTQQ